MKGLGAFLMRGNVIDLAVAVVVGGAFGAVVTAFVKDLIAPLIALVFGKPDLSGLTLTINSSVFLLGDFANAVIAFATVAATIYYVVVVPQRVIATRFAKPPEAAPVATCPECLSEVPAAARRCRSCTALLPAP